MDRSLPCVCFLSEPWAVWSGQRSVPGLLAPAPGCQIGCSNCVSPATSYKCHQSQGTRLCQGVIGLLQKQRESDFWGIKKIEVGNRTLRVDSL